MEDKLYKPDFLRDDDELMSAAEARRRTHEHRDDDKEVKEQLKQCQQWINEACEEGEGFIKVSAISLRSETKSRLKEEGYELTPCGRVLFIHWEYDKERS